MMSVYHVNPRSKFQTEDQRVLFLQELMQNLDRISFRLLLTSRDVPDIRIGITKPSSSRSLRIQVQELKITSDNNHKDICEVSRCIVDKKLPNKDIKIREEMADLAANKCEWMFLMLDLIGNGLKPGKNSKALLSSVAQMPAGIEAAYTRDLERLVHMNDEDKQWVVAVLRWIMFSIRPLTVAELIEAAALAVGGAVSFPWDNFQTPGRRSTLLT